MPKQINWLYGTRSYVCRNHRSIVGAAWIRNGECEACKARTVTACGSLPLLCDECSIERQECKFCRKPGVPKHG